MLRESGRVESVHDGFAWVVCAAQLNCKLCAEGRGCGGGLLGRLLGDRLHRVRAITGEQRVSVGDRVELSLSESALVTGALQVYLVPLAGFLGAPLMASWLFGLNGDFPLLATALAGLMLGMLLARKLAAARPSGQRFQPAITRRIDGECEGVPALRDLD